MSLVYCLSQILPVQQKSCITIVLLPLVLLAPLYLISIPIQLTRVSMMSHLTCLANSPWGGVRILAGTVGIQPTQLAEQ